MSHDDGIMSHWLIRPYHDLSRNVGYEPEQSEVLVGTKDGVRFEVVIDVLRRPAS